MKPNIPQKTCLETATGENYVGTINKASGGRPCQVGPFTMMAKNLSLRLGTQFIRVFQCTILECKKTPTVCTKQSKMAKLRMISVGILIMIKMGLGVT